MTSVELAAVQTRMVQLASLVAPPPASGDATGTDFATVLASALGASQPVATDVADVGLAAARSTEGRGGSTGAGVAVPGQVTGQDLVDAARRYLGVPYLWGGESPAEGGLDCSGLVQRSLADLGVTGVPRVARDQATLGTPVASLADARPGDLVVFDGGKHIGIYAGEGKMIDAPRPGKAVQLRDVYETPTTIRRILPAEPADAGTASGTVSGTVSAAVPGAGSTLVDDLTAQRALVAALLTGAAA